MAYDDGYNAALTDAKSAEDERFAQLEHDHQDDLARARAEAIAAARNDAKVTPIKPAAPANQAAKSAPAANSDAKAPLYEDMAKRLTRP